MKGLNAPPVTENVFFKGVLTNQSSHLNFTLNASGGDQIALKGQCARG